MATTAAAPTFAPGKAASYESSGIWSWITTVDHKRIGALYLYTALGFFIFGAAPNGPLFWLGIPVMALWGIAGAATQALTTQLAAPEQQGQLQGATNSVQSVSQLIGPFLFTLTFAWFIGASVPLKLPGAPFYLASTLLLLALAIAARTLSMAKAR